MASANSVCRVCLAGNIKMLRIDNVHLLQLFEKLTNSQLNTESDARMPSTVCFVCHRQLQRCHQFSDLARRSDETMRDMLNNGIQITGSTITMLSLATKSTLSMAPTQHMSVIGYTNNATAAVKDERVVVKIEERAETDEPVFEESQVAPDEDNEAVERNVNKVEKEQDNIHLRFYCDICNKKMLSKHHLVSHLKAHTIKNTLSCNQCDSIFTRKSHLKMHRRIHTGEKPYTCMTCDKAFRQASYLRSHMRLHTGEKPYSCITCDKAFIQKDDLTKHMRLHTGEKPYACMTCDKAFSQTGHLRTHMRIHSGEKPYSCITCDKAFSQNSALKCHMRIHTGEKPYACIICAKAFSVTGHLSSHMRIHTGEKPYSCITCAKAFSRTGHLRRHMRIHTGEKLY